MAIKAVDFAKIADRDAEVYLFLLDNDPAIIFFIFLLIVLYLFGGLGMFLLDLLICLLHFVEYIMGKD